MGSIYETDEFLDLRDEVYAKLREEGFADIEVIDKRTRQPGGVLLGPSSGDLRRSEHRIRYVNESAEYYQLARAYMWELSGTDRTIWEMHAEGWSTRDIHAALARFGMTLNTIKKTVKHHRDIILRRARYGED